MALGALVLRAVQAPVVTVGGSLPLKFPTRHAAQAVFSLALAEGGTMSTDEICARLWPDAPESRMARRLATMTWQVRRTLGEASWRIQRQPTELNLDLDGVCFDVAELRAKAASILDGSAPFDESVASGLEAELLAGWDEPWVEAERAINASLAAELRSRTTASV